MDIISTQTSAIKHFTVILSGRKRIGMVITNHAKHGFFNNLTESYNIHAPLVFIECKNYGTIGEKETEQISGRLSKKRGMFGILMYRKIKDTNRLWERSTDLVSDKDEYILPLNDDDIIVMLKSKSENEEIDEYLDSKMQRLLLH